MWKKNVLIRGIFCMMHSFRFFQKLKILVFIKNASQVAILKKEHCKFRILYLHNSLLFIFRTSNPFQKKIKKYISF